MDKLTETVMEICSIDMEMAEFVLNIHNRNLKNAVEFVLSRPTPQLEELMRSSSLLSPEKKDRNVKEAPRKILSLSEYENLIERIGEVTGSTRKYITYALSINHNDIEQTILYLMDSQTVQPTDTKNIPTKKKRKKKKKKKKKKTRLKRNFKPRTPSKPVEIEVSKKKSITPRLDLRKKPMESSPLDDVNVDDLFRYYDRKHVEFCLRRHNGNLELALEMLETHTRMEIERMIPIVSPASPSMMMRDVPPRPISPFIRRSTASTTKETTTTTTAAPTSLPSSILSSPPNSRKKQSIIEGLIGKKKKPNRPLPQRIISLSSSSSSTTRGGGGGKGGSRFSLNRYYDMKKKKKKSSESSIIEVQQQQQQEEEEGDNKNSDNNNKIISSPSEKKQKNEKKKKKKNKNKKKKKKRMVTFPKVKQNVTSRFTSPKKVKKKKKNEILEEEKVVGKKKKEEEMVGKVTSRKTSFTTTTGGDDIHLKSTNSRNVVLDSEAKKTTSIVTKEDEDEEVVKKETEEDEESKKKLKKKVKKKEEEKKKKEEEGKKKEKSRKKKYDWRANPEIPIPKAILKKMRMKKKRMTELSIISNMRKGKEEIHHHHHQQKKKKKKEKKKEKKKKNKKNKKKKKRNKKKKKKKKKKNKKKKKKRNKKKKCNITTEEEMEEEEDVVSADEHQHFSSSSSTTYTFPPKKQEELIRISPPHPQNQSVVVVTTTSYSESSSSSSSSSSLSLSSREEEDDDEKDLTSSNESEDLYEEEEEEDEDELKINFFVARFLDIDELVLMKIGEYLTLSEFLILSSTCSTLRYITSKSNLIWTRIVLPKLKDRDLFEQYLIETQPKSEDIIKISTSSHSSIVYHQHQQKEQQQQQQQTIITSSRKSHHHHDHSTNLLLKKKKKKKKEFPSSSMTMMFWSEHYKRFVQDHKILKILKMEKRRMMELKNDEKSYLNLYSRLTCCFCFIIFLILSLTSLSITTPLIGDNIIPQSGLWWSLTFYPFVCLLPCCFFLFCCSIRASNFIPVFSGQLERQKKYNYPDPIVISMCYFSWLWWILIATLIKLLFFRNYRIWSYMYLPSYILLILNFLGMSSVPIRVLRVFKIKVGACWNSCIVVLFGISNILLITGCSMVSMALDDVFEDLTVLPYWSLIFMMFYIWIVLLFVIFIISACYIFFKNRMFLNCVTGSNIVEGYCYSCCNSCIVTYCCCVVLSLVIFLILLGIRLDLDTYNITFSYFIVFSPFYVGWLWWIAVFCSFLVIFVTLSLSCCICFCCCSCFCYCAYGIWAFFFNLDD